jgi:hypothetical protein
MRAATYARVSMFVWGWLTRLSSAVPVRSCADPSGWLQRMPLMRRTRAYPSPQEPASARHEQERAGFRGGLDGDRRNPRWNTDLGVVLHPEYLSRAVCEGSALRGVKEGAIDNDHAVGRSGLRQVCNR